MDSQFSRTELLIGQEGIKKLQSSYVAIFGIGGVGSYVLESLVRSGIGRIDIIDNDKVVLSNINRQLFATHSSVGEYKVDVAKKRMLDINPNLKINTFKTFYTPETKSEFDFSRYDYVVDAIDTVVGKLSLIEECKKVGTKIICAMGAGNKMDATRFEVTDISKTSVCPLARVIRTELKKRKIKDVKVVYSKELPLKVEIPQDNAETSAKKRYPGSNSFVPPVVGFIIAGEVIKELI